MSMFMCSRLQGWLGRVDTPLAAAASRDAAAGGVLALRWSGALVAWAFDSAVSVSGEGWRGVA